MLIKIQIKFILLSFLSGFIYYYFKKYLDKKKFNIFIVFLLYFIFFSFLYFIIYKLNNGIINIYLFIFFLLGYLLCKVLYNWLKKLVKP